MNREALQRPPEVDPEAATELFTELKRKQDNVIKFPTDRTRAAQAEAETELFEHVTSEELEELLAYMRFNPKKDGLPTPKEVVARAKAMSEEMTKGLSEQQKREKNKEITAMARELLNLLPSAPRDYIAEAKKAVQEDSSANNDVVDASLPSHFATFGKRGETAPFSSTKEEDRAYFDKMAQKAGRNDQRTLTPDQENLHGIVEIDTVETSEDVSDEEVQKIFEKRNPLETYKKVQEEITALRETIQKVSEAAEKMKKDESALTAATRKVTGWLRSLLAPKPTEQKAADRGELQKSEQSIAALEAQLAKHQESLEDLIDSANRLSQQLTKDAQDAVTTTRLASSVENTTQTRGKARAVALERMTPEALAASRQQAVEQVFATFGIKAPQEKSVLQSALEAVGIKEKVDPSMNTVELRHAINDKLALVEEFLRTVQEGDQKENIDLAVNGRMKLVENQLQKMGVDTTNPSIVTALKETAQRYRDVVIDEMIAPIREEALLALETVEMHDAQETCVKIRAWLGVNENEITNAENAEKAISQILKRAAGRYDNLPAVIRQNISVLDRLQNKVAHWEGRAGGDLGDILLDSIEPVREGVNPQKSGLADRKTLRLSGPVLATMLAEERAKEPKNALSEKLRKYVQENQQVKDAYNTLVESIMNNTKNLDQQSVQSVVANLFKQETVPAREEVFSRIENIITMNTNKDSTERTALGDALKKLRTAITTAEQEHANSVSPQRKAA